MHVAKCIESKHGAPLSSVVPVVSAFSFCPRLPQYEVEDISSRVKKRNRTEGDNASAHCTNRTSKCGADQRSAEDCVGMGEADNQLTGSPNCSRGGMAPCHCDLLLADFCGVYSRRSVLYRLNMGPPGMSEPSCYPQNASAIAISVVEDYS